MTLMDRLSKWTTWKSRNAIVFVLLAACTLFAAAWFIKFNRRGAACQIRCNQVSHAFHLIEYHNQMKEFLPMPVRYSPDGRPLSSWRFFLSDAYGETSLLGPHDFSAPWDADANRSVVNLYFRGFFSDSFRDKATIYAIVGPYTGFSGTRMRRGDLPPNLALLIEASAPKYHWMEPGDLQSSEVCETDLKGPTGDGVLVAFVDTSIWHVRPDTPIDLFKKFLTVHDAKNVDRSELLPFAKEVKQYYFTNSVRIW